MIFAIKIMLCIGMTSVTAVAIMGCAALWYGTLTGSL